MRVVYREHENLVTHELTKKWFENNNNIIKTQIRIINTQISRNLKISIK